MEFAAAILLRNGSHPIAASPEGRTLLESEHWVRVAAAVTSSLTRGSSPGILSVPKPAGRSAWLVCLTPMYESDTGSNGSHLLVIFDPDRHPQPPIQALREIFHLTRAEARLVEQLLLGRGPSEAAQALGVTIHTVRTYLKRLYGKLGVNSQAMLVRRLLQAVSLPAVPPV